MCLLLEPYNSKRVRFDEAMPSRAAEPPGPVTGDRPSATLLEGLYLIELIGREIW